MLRCQELITSNYARSVQRGSRTQACISLSPLHHQQQHDHHGHRQHRHHHPVRAQASVDKARSLLKGTLEITLPANVRNTVNNARNSMGAARMSRVSSHNKKQQNRRIVEREGSIVGCWNVYDRTLRYPFQVTATVQSTLLNISPSAMLQVCNEYLSDKETLTSARPKAHRPTTAATNLTRTGRVECASQDAAAEKLSSSALRESEAKRDV